LIDSEDAASYPTKAVEHMDRTTHSPRTFQDDHGAEVDPWGVGELLREALPSTPGATDVLRQFGHDLKLGKFNTAERASTALGELTAMYG